MVNGKEFNKKGSKKGGSKHGRLRPNEESGTPNRPREVEKNGKRILCTKKN